MQNKKYNFFDFSVSTLLVFLLFILTSCSTPTFYGSSPIQNNTPQESFFEFSSSLLDLPLALSPQTVTLRDHDMIPLVISPVKKEINGTFLPMYAYNGMIPGPTLHVKQGTTVFVNVTNQLDYETTIHWHGLRHNISFDGVPGVSQDPIKPGASFVYTLTFPDAGIFWYHPHIREDLMQETGLAGTILVDSMNEDSSPPANQEHVLVLDDILIEHTTHAPFGSDYATYAIMGRFGNVLLVNGNQSYHLTVDRNSVVRFYLVNAANVRPFNLSFPSARMKLIGADLGLYVHETFVDAVVLAPGERVIVDVLFDQEGSVPLVHTTPAHSSQMGVIDVRSSIQTQRYDSEFETLHLNSALQDEIGSYLGYANTSPDYVLNLDISMPGMQMGDMEGMMPHEGDGIEWEDTMPMMNAWSTSKILQWFFEDEKTHQKNMNLTMQAKTGDIMKLRLINSEHSMHPMHHPIHLHGQRFLVLSVNGVPTPNYVWKDTMLVPIGATVDLLIDASNPGNWMLHCHIAEHLESGMMTSLLVSEENETLFNMGMS